MVSVARLRQRITSALRSAPVPTPDLDARLIVAHVLGLDATGLLLCADRAVTESDAARAMALAERRMSGEPVARLTGEKEFWSLALRLSPETLVPRPDTETLVAAALDWVRDGGRADRPLSILDLGTGSGAILLALLSELPQAWGLGIDLSEGAARAAAGNAARHGLADRARFAVSDWDGAIGGRFDLVVSNPPYVGSAAIPELPVEVARFDPHLALDGGKDGLAAHRRVMAAIRARLSGDGAAFVEIGEGQFEAVARLAENAGFSASARHDLAGIERVVALARGSEGAKIGLGNQTRTG